MSAVQTETQTIHKVFKLPTKLAKDGSSPWKGSPVRDDNDDLQPDKHEWNNNEDATSPKVEYKMQIVWFNAVGFLILHLAAVYAIYLGFTSAKLLTSAWSTNNNA